MTTTIYRELELTLGGGTYSLNLQDKSDAYLITGSARLSSNWTIEPDLSDPSIQPFAGMSVTLICDTTVDVNGSTVTVFGVDVSYLIDAPIRIECMYDGSAWIVHVFESSI